MKSFVIEIEDRDENALIEILRRFAIKIHPAHQGTIKKAKIEPKTVADFLQVSHTLTAWDDDEVDAISELHNQLNQHQPSSW